MNRRIVSIALALCAVLGVPLAAHAGALYTVTVIGGANSEGLDVNAFGQVVGQMQVGSNYHGFYYNGSTLIDLGTLGGANSVASGLNDSGTVVGSADGVGMRQGFVYTGGVLAPLSLAGPSEANGINNAGAIVGTAAATDSEGFPTRRAVIYSGGMVIDLGTIKGGYGSAGNAINNRGHVAGDVEFDGPPNFPSHPFLYRGGMLQELGDFGGVFSHGFGINNHDQLVGTAGKPYVEGSPDLYPRSAFLYDTTGMHDLGALIEGGSSVAYDINDKGQVVGYSDTAGGGGGFLYQSGAMLLLDTLIDPASGWSIAGANAINELGQIAATACRAGLCYAVRLDPTMAVPEPAPGAMLIAGAIVLLLGSVAGGAGSGPARSGSARKHLALGWAVLRRRVHAR